MVGGNKNMSKENTAVTKKKIKRCKEDVVFDAACFIILTLVLFVVAYPLYWVIISSISAPSAVSSGKVLLHPIGFTLKGYAEVFKNDQVMRGFLNSLIITFCGVMVNLIVTLPTSYALSRSNFSGKKPITIFRTERKAPCTAKGAGCFSMVGGRQTKNAPPCRWGSVFVTSKSASPPRLHTPR